MRINHKHFTERFCSYCRVVKSSEHFYPSCRDGYRSRCIECSKKYAKEHRLAHPELRKTYLQHTQEWRDRNREWCRFQHLLHTYHLTLDQYAALDESQDFQCAICGRDDVELHVDHNHLTHKVRGLLCCSCNMGLGNFYDSEQRMLRACAYLETKGSYASEMGGS